MTKCHQLKLEAAGGKIAKKARLELEGKTGKSFITSDNYLPPSKKKLSNSEEGEKG